MCLVTFEEFAGYLEAARSEPAQRYTVAPGILGSWVVYDNEPRKVERNSWQTERDARAEAARLNTTANR
jgi:hypothetical protein